MTKFKSISNHEKMRKIARYTEQLENLQVLKIKYYKY